MGFGDELQRIAAAAMSRNASDFDLYVKTLPQEWIAANIDLLKAALIDAARKGNDNYELESFGVRIDYNSKQWHAVSNRIHTITDSYDPNFENHIIKILKEILSKDRMKVAKVFREGRYKQRKFVYHRWLIRW
jgi:hypothetical protein